MKWRTRVKISSKYKYFILNFIVSFLTVYGVVMFLPMLPALQNYFNVSVNKISWLPNIGYLNMIIFSPIIGKLIKKIKVNKVLLSTVVIWIVGIVVEFIAIKTGSFYTFCAGRFIEAIGEAAFFPLLLIINTERVKDEHDNKVGSSIIEIGGSVGGLVAGILAGLMINKLETFLFIPMALGFVTLAYIFFTIEDIHAKEGKKEVILQQENKSIFNTLLILIFLCQGVFVSVQVYLSYYLAIFQKSGNTGVIISLEQLAIAAGALAPVMLLKRFSMIQIRNTIIPTFIIGIFLISLNISYIVSVSLFIIICFVVGVSFSTLNIALSKVAKNNISQKISLYTSFRFLGGFVFSYILGNIIGKLFESGVSYNQIFTKIYLSIGVLILIFSSIVLIIQSKGLKKNL